MEGVHGKADEWDHRISAGVKEGPADCIRIAEEMKRYKAQAYQS